MENIVCHEVSVFASYRESGKQVVGSGEAYRIKTFPTGFTFEDIAAPPRFRMYTRPQP